VYLYLNFGYVPGPDTIFQHVSVLPPGSIGIWKKGTLEVAAYWDVTYPGDADASADELALALRRQLERCVRERWPDNMSADAVGVFLSGGTDSGTIAAILAQNRSHLKAFTIAFAESAYNELSYAKAIAGQYRLDHSLAHLSADDLLASTSCLVAGLDQPLGDSSLVATFRCARLARETGVSLLLAGDGGDELFGGNERYAIDALYARYARTPLWLRKTVLACLHALPDASHTLNRARNVAYRGTLSNPERFYSGDALASRYWDSLLDPEFRDQLTRDAPLDVVRRHYHHADARTDLDRLLCVDLKMAIAGSDLVKVTTAGRLAGVRVRFPMLDATLAAFTGRLPSTLKVRGREKRYLFKQAVADLLPERVREKPKHGFGVPVGEWIRANRRVRDEVLGPLIDDSRPLGAWMTRAGLERLVDDHLHARWNYGPWLWALMMLARWNQSRRGRRVPS
jgi:asparagine synthase (glutamine-hydrolysing)